MMNKIILNYPEKSRKCIQNLKLTSPSQDRAKIESRHGNVCKKYLQKVCEHEIYKRWKSEDETRLLWIHSHTNQTFFKSRDFDTGDQKRIVAAAIAKELERSLVVHGGALSYVFCENSKNPDLKLNDTAAILRGLMWLLSLTQESLTACLEDRYNGEGKSMYTDDNAKRALLDIFSKWLKGPNVSRVYLVVGAIDECYMERKDMVDFLDLIIMCCKDLPKVKWLITSDCYDIYLNHYIKPRLNRHRTSFETIHLNESSRKREPGRKAKAPGKGTEGTNQEIQRGGKESAQRGEEYLGKRKRRASDIIPEENVKKYVGEFFEGAAGDKRLDTPEVSSRENGANLERAKGKDLG